MAVPDVVPVLPDALAFPGPAAAHPGLRLPCPDAAEIPRAECWLDADRDAARPVDRHMEVANPEVRPDPKAAGAGKSAVREPRPADAVPDRLALACRRPGARAKPLDAAVERCKQDEGRSAA
jgi:hypothetical protein